MYIVTAISKIVSHVHARFTQQYKGITRTRRIIEIRETFGNVRFSIILINGWKHDL